MVTQHHFSKNVIVPLMLILFSVLLTSCSDAAGNESFKTEANQAAVTEFENSVRAFENYTDATYKNYTKVMKGSGAKYTVNDAYEAASKAKDLSKDIMVKITEIKVEKSLPKAIRDQLEDCKSDASTIYYEKSKAFEASMAFLDNQKPSDAQIYKDSMAMANQFALSYAANLLNVKKEVGITE